MSVVRHISREEWRYWQRTKLGITVLIIGIILTIASVIENSFEMRHATHERQHLQNSAEEQFLEQPDRHPHRMVHYGHYAFRAPSPLSIVEPGVDAYTGTSIFLEGHRQNSAMFADQRQSSGLTRFSSLSPSFLMQVLAPLFIIFLGYASVTREKEAGTFNIIMTQGVSLSRFLLGKFKAIYGAGLVLLLPLVVAAVWSYFQGESLVVIGGFLLGYALYFLIWTGLVLVVSALSHKSSASFATLLALWVIVCILVPRIGSSAAAAIEPSPGKLESDFAVLEELRKLGDGHNASDPAFAKLKSNLLAQYDVEKVEDLPINFRGVVAQYSEKKLTDVLNQFAEKRMQEERSQALISRQFGWISPTVAIRSFSMMIAGTSLETHHRFLREAETLRFNFVQSLNQVHQENLNYQTDVDRYKSKESARAARVDSDNWKILSEFSFKPEPGKARWKKSLPYAAQLILWCILIALFLKVIQRKVEQ